MRVLTLSLITMLTTIVVTAQQLPDYFLSPPEDTIEELFAIGVGQTEEAAFAIAMVDLATKVESYKSAEGENISYMSETTEESMKQTSKQVFNQQIFRFKVQSLTETYIEETLKGKILSEKSTQTIKLFYQVDEECFYIIEHYTSYSNVNDVEDEKTTGLFTWENCAFINSKRYINENSEMDYILNETMGNWYTIVSLKTSSIVKEDE